MKSKLLVEISDQTQFEILIKKCIEESTIKILNSLQDTDDTLMTIAQCCEYLQISRVKLWQLTSNGAIPSIRVGNSLRFQKKEVLKALNKNI